MSPTGGSSLGYNILGSYAADQARLNPDLGLVLLRDFTVVDLACRAGPAGLRRRPTSAARSCRF